jgi:hypothetical protein
MSRPVEQDVDDQDLDEQLPEVDQLSADPSRDVSSDTGEPSRLGGL